MDSQGGAWCSPRLLVTPQPLLDQPTAPTPELSKTCSGAVVITGARDIFGIAGSSSESAACWMFRHDVVMAVYESLSARVHQRCLVSLSLCANAVQVA